MEPKSNFFAHFSFPIFVYSVLSTFFLYKNLSGITVILFVGSTIWLCRYAIKYENITPKKNRAIYEVLLLLLGISTVLTGNSFIIFFNYVFMFLLVLCLLLHHYYPDETWNFGTYFSSLILSVMGAVSMIGIPYADWKAYHTEQKGRKNDVLPHILLGLLISIPLLLIVLTLLASADIVFSHILSSVFSDIFHLPTLIGITLLFVFFFLSSYCGLRYMNKRDLFSQETEQKKYSAVTAITMLLPITFAYLVFSVVQIIYLFMGKMALPADYTYATYAREGFFQLLAVSVINVLLVVILQWLFRKHVLLQILLTIVSACTYIMIASSALRMLLYIQVYHLTFLRVLVLWTLAVLAFFLIGILIQIYRPAFPLFRYGVLLFSVCYLLLSLSHVDYFIARYDLQTVSDTGSPDYSYIVGLSTDAAPALVGAEESIQRDFMYQHENELTYHFRTFNLSHFMADRILSDL